MLGIPRKGHSAPVGFSRMIFSGLSENALCSVCSAISSQTLATRSKCARRTGVALCADRKHSAHARGILWSGQDRLVCVM
jgi:hypothetical protein